MTRFVYAVGVWLAITLTAIPGVSLAQGAKGVVVDQTGLPLPGARVDVRRGEAIAESTTTESDGTFSIVPGDADDTVEVSLDGFETVRVPRSTATRIVMPLARATEVAEVVGSALTSSGSTMERLGSTMSTPLAQRLPAPRPRILQSLPLLPAVVRGRDGLLRIGGTLPHESSLWIDGFDVTDPVTLTTTIDLPNESVKGMAVVREPISATFDGVLGSMASIETTAGTGDYRAGVQGFIPRPRLNQRYGLGRIEAFYPRAYGSGHLGKSRFFASAELNFERVPVPGVTNSSGTPAAGTNGVTTFARVDTDLSPRNVLTVESLFLPATTSHSGLSPLQQPAAAPDVNSKDLFGGLIDRIFLSQSDVLTLRVGVMRHDTNIAFAGNGASVLRPDGWNDNWFSAVNSTGYRQFASMTWDRGGVTAKGTHTFSVIVDTQLRSMSSTLEHQTINIEDDAGRLTRSIEFVPLNQSLAANDTRSGVGLRDLWDVTPRLQADLDVRLDSYRGIDAFTLSPRVGLRYVLDASAQTTVKVSAGRFVGAIPLGALAFSEFPTRIDRTFDPTTGAQTAVTSQVFQTRALELPYADGVTLELERTIRPGIDAQAGIRFRTSSRLPTVTTAADGPVWLESVGKSTYREFQASIRREWAPDRQLFVSYVHSFMRGESNDFGSMFTNLDAPIIEPGSSNVPAQASVPDRLRAWATMGLPHHVVVSPAIDWRTGFPYSLQDQYRHYVGLPNSERFPTYLSFDLTTFKTFELFSQSIDLGLQAFNLTNHFNPRDVINVVTSPRFRELTNNPGVLFGGYMQVRW
ncbi:MAG: carboxypeptidase-like regulatory domain-containing protein [Acidobacteriaceae bacterium]|jgi:hypothetical protein|nr:carboxypeptidase-like regulatory domain-containing protein [Acidobacteriaceae bacterium]